MNTIDSNTIQKILYQYGIKEKILNIVSLQESRNQGQIRLLFQISLSNYSKLVCRISNEKGFTKKLIEQQCCFSEKMRKNGIPVAKKYKASDNYCIENIYEGYMCCVTLEDYAGLDLQKVTLETFGQLGRLMGQMHAASEHDPSEIDYSVIGKAIKNLDAKFDRILANADPAVQKLSCIKKIGEKHDGLIHTLRNKLDQLPHGAVHGDLGAFNNLVHKDGKIFIIDFNLAGDEPFLCDMLACFYSSIYKYSWKEELEKIDYEKAFSTYIQEYNYQRQLTKLEKSCFGVTAALFDGLYYCKSIIEEYSKTQNMECLEKFKTVWKHFDETKHDYRVLE